ncbi:NAD(P)-binding domain-containing protein [Bacillus solimangrovi]|uniref:Flavoprotein n=1 Tax=Bacillus solimangrovi TaxID=1305675 RepID=A0A1E5LER3_9BACI|nr:NAD(P)-binding domain-containing protein [Bacillus solimangrovi]OEH92575.1 flavoprotein [Bacillus solimangrovi]
MNQTQNSSLPVAIIGGGPVGLATAAQLTKKGEDFILFEAGHTVGSSILEWGHVRMFSTWKYNIDKASRQLLEHSGWLAPYEDDLPTGKDLVEKYLLPLSKLPELQGNIVLNAKVVGVAKKGLNKLKTAQRENVPFEVYVEIDEKIKVFEAKAVIDSSGTWKSPNPALSNGIWTKAEKQLKDRIHYGIPNVNELEDRYKNKSIMVVGSGHSAINGLLDFAQLKEKFPDTMIYWVLRKKHVRETYGGQENDELQARGELGIRIQKLVESNEIKVLTPFYIRDVRENMGKISVNGDMNTDEVKISNIDELVVSTGFRPNVSFLNEIRLDLDPTVESVEALAPLIDPNIHSCGTVRPHGEAELRQSEKNFYIVGMKSYGRAPTFLLATGYEQVRSIVDYLTGDLERAKEVHLDLPETGVCSSGIGKGIVNSCCDPSPNTNSNNGNSCCG